MQINIGAKNLGALLDNGSHVSIPSFQRNYAWDRSNLEQFIADVFDSADAGTPHFFGPIVVLNDGSSQFDVVDGQQRITTAVMATCIARDVVMNEEFFPQDEALPPGMPGPVTPFLQALFNGAYLDIPKFEANYFIDKLFQKAVVKNPSPDRPVIAKSGLALKKLDLSPAEVEATKEFRAAYLYLKDAIEAKFQSVPSGEERKQFAHNLSLALTSGFQLLTMEVSNEDDAYALFENLNHRGVRLAPADLLKTLTLRNIRQQGEEQLGRAIDDWDDMISVSLGGSFDFTKYLRHYLLTRRDYPIQASKIYSEFKSIIDDSGPNGAATNLQSLVESAEMYSQLIGVSAHPNAKLRHAFSRLELIGDTHKILLLRAMQCQLSEPQLERLTRAVEMLTFRWVANGGNAQVLENHFRKHGHQLLLGADAAAVSEVCDSLVALAPSDEALTGLASCGKDALAKYALQSLEDIFGAGYFQWDNPPTLEHLAPQKPGKNTAHWHAATDVERSAKENESTVEHEYARVVHLWGNLTILEAPLNSSIKNGPWIKKRQGDDAKKYDGLEKSGFVVNKEVAAAPEWTIHQIISRGDWIRDRILEARSKSWVDGAKPKFIGWQP